MTWITAYTGWQREQEVYDNLLDLALEIYMPMQRVQRRRRLRSGAHRPYTINQPLFPRYVFADMEPELFFRVPLVRGVQSVVSSGEQFLVIPDKVMAALKKPSNLKPSLPHRVGDTVRITTTSLSTFISTISSVAALDSTGHIKVWLEMLGSREVSIHHSKVERLDQTSAHTYEHGLHQASSTAGLNPLVREELVLAVG